MEYTLAEMPNATGGNSPTLLYDMVVNNVGLSSQSLSLTISSVDTAKLAVSPWPFNKYQTDPRQSYAYRWSINSTRPRTAGRVHGS